MEWVLKKKYESRKEGAYICLCTDAEGDCPIVLQSVKDKSYVMTVTKDGFFRPNDGEDPGDIIGEWVEPKVKKRLARFWYKEKEDDDLYTVITTDDFCGQDDCEYCQEVWG